MVCASIQGCVPWVYGSYAMHAAFPKGLCINMLTPLCSVCAGHTYLDVCRGINRCTARRGPALGAVCYRKMRSVWVPVRSCMYTTVPLLRPFCLGVARVLAANGHNLLGCF